MAPTSAHSTSGRSWLLASFLTVAIILALVIHDATACDTGYSLRGSATPASCVNQPAFGAPDTWLAVTLALAALAYFSYRALTRRPSR